MAKTAIVAASATVIESISIRRDDEGRYSLNDLHRAAMMAGKATESQRPGEFLKTEGVKAFVAAYDADENDVQKRTSNDAKIFASVHSVKGGKSQGTYAAELIAIRYAAWIDPSFEVKVYRTFQSAAQKSNDWQRLRHSASATNKAMNAVLQAVRADAGKDSAAHHFINEALLVNEALSGHRAGLNRDALSQHDLDLLAYLEARNTAMIGRGMAYKDRKSMISKLAEAWKFDHSLPLLPKS